MLTQQHAIFQPQPLYVPTPAPEVLWEQGSGTFNEDAYIAEDNLYGVFDGASSLFGQSYDGYTGAWWAANLARNAFLANDCLLDELAYQANDSIANMMQSHGVDTRDRLRLWSTSAAVARMNGVSMEYAQIGDALMVCINKDGSHFLPAPYLNHDVPTLELWQSLAQNGVMDVRSAVQPFVEQVRLEMNQTYGVLNGESAADRFLQTGSISTENLSYVLLFTDGLHVPCTNPASKGDFTEIVDVFLADGLEGVRDHVRSIEQTDPQCRIYPRFKQHDDIAAIAITL